MRKTLYIIIILILFFSCKKNNDNKIIDEIDDKIETSNPTIINKNIIGNKLTLEWNHLNETGDVQYTLRLNDSIYSNPNKNLTKKLNYDTQYTGTITATYPNEETTSVNFEFNTEKSKFLFFSTWAKTLYCINLYTKEVEWTHENTSHLDSPHLLYKNLLITATDSVRAIDIYSGKTKWAIQPNLNFKYFNSTALEGDILYVGNANGSLFAINLINQHIIWKSWGWGGLVLGDRIFITNCFNADALIAIDKSTGNYLWGNDLDPTNVSSFVSSQPVLYENNIFFGDRAGRVYSVNSENGIKNWSIDLGVWHASYGAPVIFQDNLIIPIEQTIYSINTTTSEINWINSSTDGHIYSSPYIYQNKIICCSSINSASLAGGVFVIDAASGDLIWKNKVAGSIRSSPIVFNESIYFGDTSNKFYQINVDNGEITWQFSANDRISNSAVIVIGSSEEIIYPNNSTMK